MACRADTNADPEVTLDLSALERAFAVWAKAAGITTDAQRATAVANMVAGGPAELNAVKAILNCVTFRP